MRDVDRRRWLGRSLADPQYAPQADRSLQGGPAARCQRTRTPLAQGQPNRGVRCQPDGNILACSCCNRHGFLNDLPVTDVVGENEDEPGIDLHALVIAFAFMGGYDPGIDVIGAVDIRGDDESAHDQLPMARSIALFIFSTVGWRKRAATY